MDNKCPAEKVELAKNQIKRENFDEEIKEYAETAMNELLGWYGYGTAKEDMKSTGTCQSNSNSNSSGPPSPHTSDGCGWCGKTVEDKTGISAGSLSFCSELCFSQSRRANFKKNKTCDWCRHVRHTVSYVDFQDGASQLQFCSDKCLNQYKMHIFCRETRAHLEMHPHMPIENSGSGLITPDLWMKNCKSPERNTPSPEASINSNRDPIPQTSPLPLITVAHPSKLLAPSSIENSIEQNKRKRTPVQKKQKKRCPSTITSPCFAKIPNDVPQDLRVRHSPSPLFDNQQLRENFERLRPHHEIPFPPQDVRIPPPHLFNPNFPPMRLPPPPKPPAQGILPPVTVLVPYPILVPVPMPIPIPLPLQSFIDAEKTRKERNDIPTSSQESSQEGKESSEPLNLESEKINSHNQNGEHQSGEPMEETVEDCDLSKNGVTRHLRKRKRVVEPRNKIILKTKKPLST